MCYFRLNLYEHGAPRAHPIAVESGPITFGTLVGLHSILSCHYALTDNYVKDFPVNECKSYICNYTFLYKSGCFNMYIMLSIIYQGSK